MSAKAAIYIATQEQLEGWLEVLAAAPVIAVDTESDSFHSYREKVCLIQMTALDEDALIDPLAVPDLSPLGAVLGDADRLKVFHDAGYDLVCLQRDFGFTVAGLFDTMWASRLLGWREFGLATVLQQRYGFVADKRLQRSDWGRRPLSEEQIAYARFDTHFLPRLCAELTAELVAQQRLSWAQEDFERLARSSARLEVRRQPEDGDAAFWRVKGVGALSPLAKGRLRGLCAVRQQLAERLDRPLFKVFSDAVLLDLAKHPPRHFNELLERPGVSRHFMGRCGREVWRALREAEPVVGEPPVGAGRKRRKSRALDGPARERYEALRVLRRDLAQNVGLDPEVALSNALLEDLARDPPTSAPALLAREEFSGWRGPIFGATLLAMMPTDGVPGASRRV